MSDRITRSRSSSAARVRGRTAALGGNWTLILALVATVPATNISCKAKRRFPAAQSEQRLISCWQLPVWAPWTALCPNRSPLTAACRAAGLGLFHLETTHHYGQTNQQEDAFMSPSLKRHHLQLPSLNNFNRNFLTSKAEFILWEN